MPVIPELGRQRQENDHKFKASQDYILRLCLKIPKEMCVCVYIFLKSFVWQTIQQSWAPIIVALFCIMKILNSQSLSLPFCKCVCS